MNAVEWAPEASPQSRAEIRHAQPCPEVVATAWERGITSIVHFTRITGLVGVLASSAVKARRDLPSDAHVKHVYKANAVDRSRDWPWHDYINLSVSMINLSMFNPSRQWHPDDAWVILEFGPEILGDPGTVFCTTNNAYDVVRRGTGLQGFAQMFAPRVPWGHYGSVHNRFGRESFHTTDPQAEVLYPFELSLTHLHTITAGNDDEWDAVNAALSHFSYQPKIKLDPEAFR